MQTAMTMVMVMMILLAIKTMKMMRMQARCERWEKEAASTNATADHLEDQVRVMLMIMMAT